MHAGHGQEVFLPGDCFSRRPLAIFPHRRGEKDPESCRRQSPVPLTEGYAGSVPDLTGKLPAQQRLGVLLVFFFLRLGRLLLGDLLDALLGLFAIIGREFFVLAVRPAAVAVVGRGAGTVRFRPPVPKVRTVRLEAVEEVRYQKLMMYGAPLVSGGVIG